MAIEVLHLLIFKLLADRISCVARSECHRRARILIAQFVSRASRAGDGELPDCVVGGTLKTVSIEVLALLPL